MVEDKTLWETQRERDWSAATWFAMSSDCISCNGAKIYRQQHIKSFEKQCKTSIEICIIIVVETILSNDVSNKHRPR